ncbi:substrate-binding domain-containing protein [Novosphingobium sp. FSY-8]|uniref:Substrate-binding domain-containing protein n=1 Tax=Novosphingobium ovatum TaxID=1908523 RepID=A0ABW9X958_9SPHN|nr:LacI family DNA-binding transcriptional regulator [Novosphingobium ovatum]NBC35069.1 substrate-binding domain-containing protein [Novosphingobium ovatum]
MPTIKDVAKLAGVSFKTVARVVNGEPSVGKDLRERVEVAIRELGYRPSLAARQLAAQKSFIIGLIVPRAGISYIARMMIAVASACREQGYQVTTETIDWRGDNYNAAESLRFASRPDAVIVAPPFCNDAVFLQGLADQGLPIVRIAGVTDAPGMVIPVHEAPISIRLVEHLIALGHTRIGMVAPPLPIRASEERLVGYRAALAAAGIAYDPDLVIRGDFNFAGGVRAVTEMLALPQRPTAVFAASDDMAAGVLAQAHKLGFRVPDDLAVAGFDDAPLARMVWPPLTTVRQPVSQIAQAAVHAAIHQRVPEVSFQHELIIRGSTNGDRQHCLDIYAF